MGKLVCAGFAGFVVFVVIFFKLPFMDEARASECPNSLDAWLLWRDASLLHLQQRGFVSGLSRMHFFMKRCEESLNSMGDKKRCFKRMDKFSEKKYRVHTKGFSLGLSLSDQQYLDDAKKRGIGWLPRELLSNDFLKALDLDDNGRMALQKIAIINKSRQQKILAFPYRSKHLPSVDNAATFGRLYVYIPSASKDIVAQFGIGSEKEGEKAQSISVITVTKGEGARVYYNDLWRLREEGRVKITTRLEANRRMEPCYDCHKSPFIPIVPHRDFNYKKYGALLSKANNLMSSYAGMKMALISSEDYGPALGIEGRLSSQQIRACGKRPSLTEKEIARIREGVQCQACHDGISRGRLNFPSGLDMQMPSRTNLAKIFVYHEGLMPPTMEDYSEAVQSGIYLCVKKDLYGDLALNKQGRLLEWLKNEACFGR